MATYVQDETIYNYAGNCGNMGSDYGQHIYFISSVLHKISNEFTQYLIYITKPLMCPAINT